MSIIRVLLVVLHKFYTAEVRIIKNTESKFGFIYSLGSVTISLSVQDTSSPSASSPYLLIDYNDTSLLSTNSVINVSLPFTGSYTYVDPGVYNINFTVYNEVSSVTQIMLFSIDAPFINYQFSVCYLLPTLTSPVNDQCNLTTTNGIYIPKQSQLVIYVAWSNPSKSFSLKKKRFFNYFFKVQYRKHLRFYLSMLVLRFSIKH
jgi:hypothetical protein